MVCRPPGALECVTNVVSGQCGEEIASATRTLGSRLLAELNCTGRKRQLICLLEYICCASAFIVVTVVTDHFSGPGRAIGPLCVCVRVCGQ